MRIKHSQNMIIVLCWAVYTVAYCGRYSYNSNINLIMDDFSVNHADAGIVTTFFFFAYGIGQVINGVMCHLYNKKILIPCVLTISSILNLLILKVPFSFIKYLWLVNGFVQSCLWSSLIDVISANIETKKLSRAMILMGSTTAAGTIFTYAISTMFVWIGDYRISFIFDACAMGVIAALWLFLYKAEPIAEQNSCNVGSETSTHNGKIGNFAALIATLAVFAVMNNFIKDGLTTWVPSILKEKYMMRDEFSILLTLVLPICGIFGAAVSVWLNRYVDNFVSLSSLMFAISAVFIAVIAIFAKSSTALLLLSSFGIVLCMMQGVNNVITSMVPLMMRNSLDSGKIAGVLNGFCYVGSTLSSYGLGVIADRGGWQAVFNLLAVLCGVCIALGIIYKKAYNEKYK